MTHTVDLDIGGMTCASCAGRIERKLRKLDGVEAQVNLATEKARVAYDDPHTIDEIIATIEAAGYQASLPTPATPATRGGWLTPARRLIGSAILATPVVAISMVPGWQFTGWQWLVFALSIPVVTVGAWPFHRAAFAAGRHGGATMDTLVSLGIAASFLWSLYALVFTDAGDPHMTMSMSMVADSSHHLYFEVASAVTVFMLVGRYLESRAKRRSGRALEALLALGAKDVLVRRGTSERRIPIGQLAIGDEFVVLPGERVATDGVVVDGASALDTSVLTGEAVPVEVEPGSAIFGGTLNAGGRLVVRASGIGADTQLAHMTRLVEQAQLGKAPVQRLADRVAAIFVPIIIALAVATFVVWLIIDGSPDAAFTAAVAVLVVACPCALGLATPTALLVGTGRGAQLGILIRGPEILESTRKVDTILLDKTGTVTTGRMTVAAVHPAPGEDATQVLAWAAAVERGSEHPIASAVVTAAAKPPVASPDTAIPEATEYRSERGFGATARIDGTEVVVGSEGFVAAAGATLSAELAADAQRLGDDGNTLAFVAWTGQVRGVIAIADTVKAGSPTAIAELKTLGLEPILLTGDNERAARTAAAQAGIGRIVAGVLPAGKVEEVRRLQAEGHVVGMAGDGVNDAAALVAADLGIAMGSGSDIAIEAADITVVGGDLGKVAAAIRLSRATLRTIKQNLFWAFAYNVVAVPIAALGLLNPMIAGAAMALSSVFVVGNSLRLGRVRLGTAGTAGAATRAAAPRPVGG